MLRSLECGPLDLQWNDWNRWVPGPDSNQELRSIAALQRRSALQPRMPQNPYAPGFIGNSPVFKYRVGSPTPASKNASRLSTHVPHSPQCTSPPT